MNSLQPVQAADTPVMVAGDVALAVNWMAPSSLKGVVRLTLNSPAVGAPSLQLAASRTRAMAARPRVFRFIAGLPQALAAPGLRAVAAAQGRPATARAAACRR